MSISTAAINSFAAKVHANTAGATPLENIIAFIKAIMPLLSMMPCLMMAKKDPVKIMARLADVYRDSKAKKKARIDKKIAPLMLEHGITESDWDAMTETAFDGGMATAKLLAAA